MTKMRQDNNVVNRTGPSMSKMKLNCYDRSDGVLSMIETKQDNDVTNRISVVYTEIRTELSWMIRQDVVYYEK